MNFWTGLILGIIIGWLVEWLIDWLFWRRDAEDELEQQLLVEERVAAAETAAAEYEERLAAAEQEYQTRLRAVEEEWQARLNLNEQQWQAQFEALERGGESPQSEELADSLARATLATAGAVSLMEEATGSELDAAEEPALFEDSILVDEMVAAELVEDLAAEWPEDEVWAGDPAALAAEASVAEPPESAWQAEEMVADAGDLAALEGMNADLIERLNLAGVGSVDALAQSDPARLAVVMGLEQTEVEGLIARAGGPVAESSLVIEEKPGSRFADDLTRIHGIGPKFAASLEAGGIASFDDLAAASPEQLRDIIKPGPMQQVRFDSWIAQAAAFAGLRAAQAGDDLTELEGIGPVYATKLRERGIATFADLAATDEGTLADIISPPAWRRINYGDWIAQARLAAAGDEAGLHAYQSTLFRRSGDNLGLIHGMGSRSAAALQAAGIASFADLAASSPEQIETTLREAGVRGSADYNAWIAEAAIRASGKRVPAARSPVTHVVSCPQDLSAVEGIGTAYEERLYAAGIGSYWELAEMSPTELESVLGARGLQDDDIVTIKASAMKLAIETNTLGRKWDGTPPDDFEALEGIGEIYERRLYEAGICTYEALAACTPEQLADICKAPPIRMPNYMSWIATAAERVAARRNE